MILLSFVPFFLLFAHTTVGGSLICSSSAYGLPLADDGLRVVQELPYIKNDVDSQRTAQRTFAEPIFLKPKFASLKNKWSDRMIQLPLIWRYSRLLSFMPLNLSSCILEIFNDAAELLMKWHFKESARLALLMYAEKNGNVRSPTVVSEWSTVHSAALMALSICVEGQRAGGVWVIRGTSFSAFSLVSMNVFFSKITKGFLDAAPMTVLEQAVGNRV